MMSESDCWALLMEYHRKMDEALKNKNEQQFDECIEKMRTVREVMEGG